MATLYSNQYLYNPINATYESVAQLPIRRGETVTLRPTYTLTAAIGATDVIRICSVPAGAKVVYLAQTNPDLDSGTTATFGLGNSTSATAFASASAGMQTATTTVVAQSALDVANNVFVANDNLLCTMSAGPTTASTGTIDWIVQIYMP
jgi:hypothetical protein